jgi:hypothetical protein
VPVRALGSWNTTGSRNAEALWVRLWLVTGETRLHSRGRALGRRPHLRLFWPRDLEEISSRRAWWHFLLGGAVRVNSGSYSPKLVVGRFSEVRVASVQHESVSGPWQRGHIAPQNGRSRASSMNSSPRKKPRSVRYPSPRSSSTRAECGVSLPDLWERWTTRALRPSKSMLPPRLAAPIASS